MFEHDSWLKSSLRFIYAFLFGLTLFSYLTRQGGPLVFSFYQRLSLPEASFYSLMFLPFIHVIVIVFSGGAESLWFGTAKRDRFFPWGFVMLGFGLAAGFVVATLPHDPFFLRFLFGKKPYFFEGEIKFFPNYLASHVQFLKLPSLAWTYLFWMAFGGWIGWLLGRPRLDRLFLVLSFLIAFFPLMIFLKGNAESPLVNHPWGYEESIEEPQAREETPLMNLQEQLRAQVSERGYLSQQRSLRQRDHEE